jgi:hypothetical protein
VKKASIPILSSFSRSTSFAPIGESENSQFPPIFNQVYIVETDSATCLTRQPPCGHDARRSPSQSLKPWAVTRLTSLNWRASPKTKLSSMQASGSVSFTFHDFRSTKPTNVRSATAVRFRPQTNTIATNLSIPPLDALFRARLHHRPAFQSSLHLWTRALLTRPPFGQREGSTNPQRNRTSRIWKLPWPRSARKNARAVQFN